MSPADLVAIRQSARATREALLLRRAKAAARGEPNAADLGVDVERLTRHILALTEPPPPPDSFAALADIDLTSADGFATASSRLQSAARGPDAPYQVIEAAQAALWSLREAQRTLPSRGRPHGSRRRRWTRRKKDRGGLDG